MRKRIIAPLCAALFFVHTAPLRAGSFESIAGKLLSAENLRSLKGHDVAIRSADDPASRDFVAVFQKKLKEKGIGVVFLDRSITQKEWERQESGAVDDSEVARFGHEKGADVVIQLMLIRPADGGKKIKILMTAVYVESNALAASEIVNDSIPSRYDLSLLPEEPRNTAALVKDKSEKLVQSHVAGIYDDPVPPPKPPRKPIELPKIELPKIELPEIDWTSGCFVGGTVLLSVGGYPSANKKKNTNDPYTGSSPDAYPSGTSSTSNQNYDFIYRILGLEYGRTGPGLGLQDRLCFALYPLNLLMYEKKKDATKNYYASSTAQYGAAWGFDFNIGYRLFLVDDYVYDITDLVAFSLIASAGLDVVPGHFARPYIQLKGQLYYFDLALRFTPDGVGFFGGLSLQWKL
ncbi:MAG: hypothetical protein LBD07_01660 [Spirochaetaceae bacterium]|nr:hypothetical protein [Spirochaetaceae bacterium]